MWDRLFDYVVQQWNVLTAAPLAFGVLFVVGVVIGWMACRKFLEERMAVMQQRLDDYQERLGLAPTDQTAYSKMTNRELRQATLDLIPKLRAFQHEIESKDRIMSIREHSRISTLPEAERSQAFQQYSLSLISQQQNRTLEFQTRYRASAIALRDELLRRLPEQKPLNLPALDHGMLAGVHPVGEAADYLERLAKLLP